MRIERDILVLIAVIVAAIVAFILALIVGIDEGTRSTFWLLEQHEIACDADPTILFCSKGGCQTCY